MNPFELAADGAVSIASVSGVDRVDAVLIAGSGWADAVDAFELLATIPKAFVAGFDVPVVEGHQSALKLIRCDDKTVLVVPRAHLYSGASPDDVAHGIRVGTAMGAHTAILTNAAGATRSRDVPGDVFLISDHINNTGESPACDFVDMSDAYSERLRDRAITIAGISGERVYLQNRGPQYETPAEVVMARVMGADLVGMSTALETIAAREMGLEVVGLSLVTNMAAGLPGATLDHDDVLATGRVVGTKLAQVLSSVVTCVLR